MKPQEKALLSALLTASSEGEFLRHYLPQEWESAVRSWPLDAPDFSFLFSANRWLQNVHFSWFLTPLQSLPVHAQQGFLSLLEETQRKPLAQMLQIPSPEEPLALAPFLETFLLYQLKRMIYRTAEIPAPEYLPHSDLNVLLALSKRQLIHLVDLLGIYDLSADLRHVVDREWLRKIHASLSKEQLLFLHYASKQPMKWISAKLGLSSWNGTPQQLQHLLHSRGLIRLGRALVSEERSLQWHLLHSLDIGRAGVVEKVLRQKQDASLDRYFKDQVLHIVKRYQTSQLSKHEIDA